MAWAVGRELVWGIASGGGYIPFALVNSQVDHPAPSPSPPALACWIVLAARSQNSSTAKASERAYQDTHRMMNVTNVRPERHWPMGPLADASGPLRPRDVKACESNGGAGLGGLDRAMDSYPIRVHDCGAFSRRGTWRSFLD